MTQLAGKATLRQDLEGSPWGYADGPHSCAIQPRVAYMLFCYGDVEVGASLKKKRLTILSLERDGMGRCE